MPVRVVSCLVGLLLVLQLSGVLHPRLRAALPADARSIALASLATATGAPATLCHHDGVPAGRDAPDDGPCEHCIFCHAVAAGFAVAPAAAASITRVAVATAVSRPRADLARVRARILGGAQPRGPPATG